MKFLLKYALIYFTIPAQLISCEQSGNENDVNVTDEVVIDEAASNFFRQNIEGNANWVASDGAISIALSNGKVLWTMGDSHIGDYDAASGTIPCLFQVRNCMLVQQKDDWKKMQTLIGNRPGIKSFFKNINSDSTWFWPAHGFEWNGFAYIYLTEFRRNGEGAFGFESTGRHYFAKTDIKTLQVAAYQLLPDFGKVDYATGFVKDDQNKYIYAFGHSPGFIESNIHVARIDLKNNLSWSFWNGTVWSGNAPDAAAITQAASNGTAIQRYKNKFVLISTEFSVGCDQGKQLFVATSTSPTGPFTKRKPIYTIKDTYKGHYPFWYTPAIHPQYINDKGILVTYCINGYADCEASCINGRSNPDHYRPRAVRVPYGILP